MTRKAGDEFTFYNGGWLMIDWVEDGWIGYAIYFPGLQEPLLRKKRPDVFEKSLSRDHCIYEGRMA